MFKQILPYLLCAAVGFGIGYLVFGRTPVPPSPLQSTVDSLVKNNKELQHRLDSLEAIVTDTSTTIPVKPSPFPISHVTPSKDDSVTAKLIYSTLHR